MCGLVGFVDYKQKDIKQELISMVNSINHRGPNDFGIEIFNESEYVVGLGHKRLSILDLSAAGHQPMFLENLVIVYNGEIYNFKEIADELIKIGCVFKSNTDTEVILHAYKKWGINAVSKFIGMFSICIYDTASHEIVLIRDRAGVKPLFIYKSEDLFMFSSELKSFHKKHNFKKEIDKDSLALFLQYGYIPQPNCIFQNTIKLEAGNYAIYNLVTKDLMISRYWNVFDFYTAPRLNLSIEEAELEVENLLDSACNYRMVSDVPVGLFLSGGYDSSLVAAMVQKSSSKPIKSFTIGFAESEHNEAENAKQVANHLGTQHYELFCTTSEAKELIPDLPFFYDEPFGDSSAIPTMLVSKFAKTEVTVALSADGGDETFAGYTKYFQALNKLNMLRKIPNPVGKIIGNTMQIVPPNFFGIGNGRANFNATYKIISELLRSGDISLVRYLKRIQQTCDVLELKKYLKHDVISKFDYFDADKYINVADDLDKALAMDYNTFLVDDILTKVDRATMSCSLEGREPLIDHRIIEFAAQLPVSFKYNEGQSKYLLRRIVHKYVPKSIMDRPKQGFSIPINNWLRTDLRYLLEENLNSEMLEKSQLFNVDEIVHLKKEFLAGDDKNSILVWYLLMFQMWYNRWM